MGPFHPYSAPPPPPPQSPWGAGQGLYSARPAPSFHHPAVLAQQQRVVTDHKAVASLILGLVSLAFVGVFAGLPAIILGATARRDIERSNGGLVGRKIAAGGIVTGLFGTGFGFVLLLWLMGSVFAPSTDSTVGDSPRHSPQAFGASADPSPTDVGPSTPLNGTRSYGSLEVVDLDESRPLHAQLAEIVARAHGRTVVLQTYLSSSSTCAAVAAALPDLRMQRALANVTLVRVDAEEYDRELGGMKLETRTAPWFYKLDAKGAATDAISADAWDANVPENMAPALARFVRPAASARRTSR